MVVVLFLCLSGAAVSAGLTRVHVFAHTDPAYHSICAVSEGVNCETVALSPYSVFAGLPVSVWGIIGYSLMGFLALSGLSRLRPHTAWPLGLLLPLFAFSVCVSAVLAYIASARIGSLCPLCMASYAINFLLLTTGVVWLKRSGIGIGAAITADFAALTARPGLTSAVLILGCISVVVLHLIVRPYWKKPGWADLPPLSSGTDSGGRHWFGAKTPAVEIVEFSDYECPHCRGAHKDIRILVARQPDRIRLVHRHYPLDTACNPRLARPFHKHACRLAEAAECAGQQGRFWEMNDAIYSIQETIKADKVDPMELAVRLGLDRPTFWKCFEGLAASGAVSRDVQDGIRLGLRGTPTFVVGGQLFLGRIPKAEQERLKRGSTAPQGPQRSAQR